MAREAQEKVGAGGAPDGARHRRRVRRPFASASWASVPIGTGVVKLLRAHRAEIATRAGRPIDVVAIADLTPRTAGIPSRRRAHRGRDVGAARSEDRRRHRADRGYEPARKFVLEAIAHGKDVVTANKALLAVHGEELVAAAEAKGVRVGFEPVSAAASRSSAPSRRGSSATGRPPSTESSTGPANHILSTMTREGRAFDDVLAEAQRMGLAEPPGDRHRRCRTRRTSSPILATLAFGVRLALRRHPTEGIRPRRGDASCSQRELGYTIKLLASRSRTAQRRSRRVGPSDH